MNAIATESQLVALIGSVRRVKKAVKLGASGFKLPVLIKPGRDPEIGYERTVPCKVAASIASAEIYVCRAVPSQLLTPTSLSRAGISAVRTPCIVPVASENAGNRIVTKSSIAARRGRQS